MVFTYERFYDIAVKLNSLTGNTCTQKELACCAYDYICEFEHIIGLPVNRRKINLGCIEGLMEAMADFVDEDYTISEAMNDLLAVVHD